MNSTATRAFRATIFCSANLDIDRDFFITAGEFSRGLAARGWEMIYGGSSAGLMGAFADEMLKAGGIVRGAITRDVAQTGELPHPGLQELVLVPDLFERKRWMMNQGDIFLIFPGGYGTLDEALEVITGQSLGAFRKPVLFVNLKGFWQAQLQAFAQLAQHGMTRSGGFHLFEVHDTLDTVWTVLDGFRRDTV